MGIKQIIRHGLEKVNAVLWLNNRKLREENVILRSQINRLLVERDNLSKQLLLTSRNVESMHDWATRLLERKA